MRVAVSLLSLLTLAGAGAPKDDGLSWHWNRDTPGCALIQHTIEGEKLTLSRAPGQDETAVSFTVRTPKIWKSVYDDGSVSLSTGVSAGSKIRVWSVENRQYEVEAVARDPAFAKSLANASSITIAHPDFGKFTVSMRDSAAAMAALRSCEDGRLRDWGIDTGAYWGLASRPRPIGSLPELFSSDIYPKVALFRSVQRNIIARLRVGADGTVESCTVPGDFPYPQFVDAVCGVLKTRARFEPARDSTGNAVAAPFVVVVSFRMAGY